jgi:1-acyl-sn-glycerol-3-phosphate acyltransferase
VILYRLAVLLSRLLAWLVFRSEVRGREHVPARGGVVLAPTHLSGFDALAIAGTLPGRRLRQMGKNQLFRHPLLSPLVISLGAFPARSAEFMGGVEAAAALAQGGEAVVIFPEGARRRRDREHRARTGAARTALTAGVPLVPVALRGTDGWRRLRRWRIAFGPPIPVEDLAALDQARAAREATDRLWDAIVRLEDELDGGPAT